MRFRMIDSAKKQYTYWPKSTLLQIGSYPLDYSFKEYDYKYLIGMSVPPVMTAQIAHEIYLQWLK